MLCFAYVGWWYLLYTDTSRYVLDKWSVICVLYLWVVGTNIVIGLYGLDKLGSDVCSTRGW